MYHLYGSPKSRAARVMWMLEELGADYEVLPHMSHTPEVLAVNPGGKIPVLVDGDAVVTDSVAILMYLADKHGALTFPVGSPERTEMTAMLLFATDELEGPLWTCAKHSFLLPEDMRALDAVTPACRWEFERALKTLAARLGSREFAVGGAFSIADILLGHIGGWAKANRFPAPEGDVDAYMTRIRARPGWQAVVKAREAA